MKEYINKGYMLPLRALYAGALTLALAVGGCGSNDSHSYENNRTKQAYENIKKNMEINGRLRHPGEWSAILLKSAMQNGKIEDPLTVSDINWLIEIERSKDDTKYNWPNLLKSDSK